MDGESSEAESLPLLPPFEDVYYQRMSWPRFLWRMTSGVVAKDYRYLRYLGKYEKFVPVKQRKSKNIFFELEPEKTKRLAELARDEGFTLTCLLISALVISTSKVYGFRDRNGEYGQLTGTPFSVRDLCSPIVGRDRLGCYVGNYITFHKFTDSTPVCEVARDYNHQRESFIPKYCVVPRTFNNWIWITTLTLFDIGLFKKKFHHGLSVTNIGSLDLKEKFGPFNIKKFHFCPSQRGVGCG